MGYIGGQAHRFSFYLLRMGPISRALSGWRFFLPWLEAGGRPLLEAGGSSVLVGVLLFGLIFLNDITPPEHPLPRFFLDHHQHPSPPHPRSGTSQVWTKYHYGVLHSAKHDSISSPQNPLSVYINWDLLHCFRNELPAEVMEKRKRKRKSRRGTDQYYTCTALETYIDSDLAIDNFLSNIRPLLALNSSD